MKYIPYFLTSGLMVMALASCEKNLEVAGAAEGNSLLSITTRTTEDNGKVSYPVLIYAMNPDGQCVRRQQITSAADQLSMKLEPMTYQIYAVGGATDGDYTLPGQDGATATSEITLNAEVEHDDLMTANNSVTIIDGENATLTLSMSRKVMEMESIVIQNVPKSVSKVSITLTPIYSDLLLNGSYTNSTFTKTIELTEAADGTTWELANPIYMLPSNGNATLTVKFEKNNTVSSYSYTAPVALEANKHIRIQGQYTGTGQFDLTGTITGVQWNGTTTIEFSFDENGSTGNSTSDSSNENQNDDGIEAGAAPAVNTVYKDCYVFSSVDDETGEYTLVSLLHKDEADIIAMDKTQETVLGEIETALPTFDINNITGWRIPTKEEFGSIAEIWGNVNLLINNNEYNASLLATAFYYYIENSTLKIFRKSGATPTYDNTFEQGRKLRPVKTLKFKKNSQ
ncbi:MAG: FimB/Mfa2 family fimbrial subunit [Prevotella sp.]|nr:FimB/Mfa2 family fimbrial subunit [Prevotella sp.]